MSEAEMKEKYGQLWDTTQLQADFTVLGFQAPLVAVARKSDGAKGSMVFQHQPRFYHSFEENSK